jgi:uncharacterized membrane protein YedE/YeeE
MNRGTLIALIAGFIFAVGLGISGMTQPLKVIGFLNVLGDWDPSLVFVMGSALIVNGLTNFLIRHKTKPILESRWDLPPIGPLSISLFLGSLLFGIGWGIAGYCPGPAFVSLVSLKLNVLIFVLAMFFGMYLFKFYESKRSS